MSSVKQHLGRARSLPEVLSQRIGLEKKLNPNQEAPSLDMYSGQAKNKPIEFDIGTKANRILRKATLFVFDSTLQGEQLSNSLEDLRVRFEKVSKTMRFHLTKEDSNQNAKSF